MTLLERHEALERLHNSLSSSPREQCVPEGDPGPPPHRLFGVRLGALERSFLLQAPSPQALTGMLIEAPEGTRSAQESYLRAARTLRRHGLVELAVVPAIRLAHDPRRAKPFFRYGAFWLRAYPTRRQVVRRKVLWLSYFGEEIVRLFDHELRSGARIRWTSNKVARAESYAARHHVDRRVREAALAQMAETLAAAADEEKDVPRGAIEYVPQFVTSGADRERWRLSVGAAASDGASRSSSVLLNDATALYLSTDTTLDELRTRARSGRPSDRPLRFSWDAFLGMRPCEVVARPESHVGDR